MGEVVELKDDDANEVRYIVELDEERYIDLMRLALKHPDEISLVTRQCIARAKQITKGRMHG